MTRRVPEAYGQCRRCRGPWTGYGQRYALPTAVPPAPWTSLRLAHSGLDNGYAVVHTAHRPYDYYWPRSLPGEQTRIRGPPITPGDDHPGEQPDGEV